MMDTPSTIEQRLEPLLHSSTTSDNNNTDNASSMHQNDHETPQEEHEAWYQNPHQVTAMLSNFSTSYNVVNISLVLPIMATMYDTNTQDSAACASSLLAGMIFGQLAGGVLGDSFLGRLGALRLVMALQIFASLASTMVVGYWSLALCRLLLGVGAGGVYPLAAVLSAEQSKSSSTSSSDQVHRVVLTFSTQGLGFVTVPILATILLHVSDNLNLIWRLLLGFGSVPGIVLMLLQWRLYRRNHARGEVVPVEEEVPPVVEGHSSSNSETANENENSSSGDNVESNNIQQVETPFQDEPEASEPQDQHEHRNWLQAMQHEPGLCTKVVGTAGTWFLFDVVFYGNTIFQPIVVDAAFGSTEDSDDPLDALRTTAINSLILTSIALPGYAVAGMIIGKKTCCLTQTPRYVMLQGFAAMSVLYATIGLSWSYMKNYPALLVGLYGMTFFFANYGPNTTTFILPSLIYSPECRSTLNGISAASGKLGALFGATLFKPAADAWGDNIVMIICSGLAVFSFILTACFVPETQAVATIPYSPPEAIDHEEEEHDGERSAPLS